MLYFQIFFEKIRMGDSLGAINFAQQNNQLLLNKSILTLNEKGYPTPITWEVKEILDIDQILRFPKIFILLSKHLEYWATWIRKIVRSKIS